MIKRNYVISPPDSTTDDIIELSPPFTFFQIPRRVKTLDGEEARFHMFYESNGTPMALVEYESGRVGSVIATWITFIKE